MLKMIKYDFIRNRLTIIILFSVLGASELLFLLGIAGLTVSFTTLGILGLFFGAAIIYFTIWLLGLISYSRDLHEKCGYMTFLVPVSPYKIIFSKLIAGFLELLLTGAVLTLLAVLDMHLVNSRFGQQLSIINSLARTLNTSVDQVWYRIVAYFVAWCFNVLVLYAFAYLATSISALISRTTGGQRALSVVFMILILIVYSVIIDKMPTIGTGSVTTFFAAISQRLPQILLNIALTTACAVGSGYLMDKKISL